jgi:3-dehydroquinate synthase
VPPSDDVTRDIEVLGYQISVRPGLVDEVGAATARVAPAHKYAIITDENVAAHWLDRVRDSFGSLSDKGDVIARAIPAGESQKTRDQWRDLSDWMVSAGCGRDTTVVALGGGVVGDLAGFVAATYMRGVPVVQVPTTLLAMVDSSIGGKTGVDTSAGKNLVGAFHHPAAVLVDPNVLATLPPRELRAGLAEMIKHGAISDRQLFDDIVGAAFDAGLSNEVFDSTDSGFTALISRCAAVKARIVRSDPKEAGERHALNAGHTVAHALEQVTNFSLLHGEAVSIGLVAESAIGERLSITVRGTSEELRTALSRVGLPVEIPEGMQATDLVRVMRVDKKGRSGAIRMALLAAIGRIARGEQGSWTVLVDEAAIFSALSAI